MKKNLFILATVLVFSLNSCTNTIEESQTANTTEFKMKKFIESEEYIALHQEMNSFGLHIKEQFLKLTPQEQDSVLLLLNNLRLIDTNSSQATENKKEVDNLLNINFTKEAAQLEILASHVRQYAQKNKLSQIELTIASNKNIPVPRLRNNSESDDNKECIATCTGICAVCLAAIGTPSGGTGAAFCLAAYAACVLHC